MLPKFCNDNAHLFFEHGFMDGGCAALAQALRYQLPDSKLMGAFRSDGVLDHVLIELKGYLIDATGIHKSEELAIDALYEDSLMKVSFFEEITLADIKSAEIPLYLEKVDGISKLLDSEGVVDDIESTFLISNSFLTIDR